MTVLGDRFELGPVIAQGGGGVVHHGWDRREAQAVAIKLLHPRGNPMDLLREVKLLSELQHPRIVRYVASGTTPDRRAFIATEWLEGTTLAALIERGPLAVPDAVAAIAAAAEGLRAAHARGIVHRDIKPSNLFAVGGRPGGVKLIDFGVAAERAGLDEEGRGGMAGTPAYVSPEQARRAVVDARSDVFSLGCVLHECLTGQRLFAGNDVPTLLRRIQFDEVPPLATPGVPPPLAALLGAMLAKAPSARPTIGEVLATLATETPHDLRLTDREERVFTVVMVRAAEGNPDRAFAAAATVGVARALADGTPLLVYGPGGEPAAEAGAAARAALRLRQSAAGLALALATGRAQLIEGLPLGPLLDGAARLLALCPPGRIRVGEETAHLLEDRFVVVSDRGVVTLEGERATADEPRLVLGRRTPFVGRGAELARLEAALAEMIGRRTARALVVTGEAGLGKSRLRQEFLARHPDLPVALARGDDREPFGVLRRLVEAIDPAAALPALGDEDPQASADRMRAAWLDWLDRQLAGPLVLVVEDADRADRPSLELLVAAQVHWARRPLLVLALARAAAAWPGFERLALEPLSADDSRALAAALDGTGALAERAAGNPLFLEELIRAEAAGEESVPDSIAALVQARIDRMPAPLRRTVRVASIFGGGFETGGLRALLPELLAEDLDAALGALAGEELLVVVGSGRHAFRHALVADAAYATLTDGDRALGHRLAAQWLAAQPAPAPAEVAHHFDRAGDPGQAGPWYVRAAERALAASDLEEALRFCERAADCGLRPEELGPLKIVEARARFWRAEYLEAELAAKRALRAAGAGSPTWFRALGELCQSLGERGEYGEIVQQLDRAAGQAPEPGAEPHRWGSLLSGIGYLAVSSRRATARAMLDGLAGSVAPFDEPTRARIHACRALLAAADGRTFVASQESAAAMALYERLGNPRRRCEMAADLGSALLELGDLDRAVALLQGVVSEAGRLGAARVATVAQVNLVQGLAWQGRTAEAAALGALALDAAREQGNRRVEAGCFGFLAEAALLEGNLAEGERLARRALTRAEGVESVRAPLQAVLAWALVRKGGRDATLALALAEEAMALTAREGHPEVNEWLLLRSHAEALEAAGRTEEAATALRAALVRLRAQADSIDEPPLREKFLSLPHPARLLELERAWGIAG